MCFETEISFLNYLALWAIKDFKIIVLGHVFHEFMEENYSSTDVVSTSLGLLKQIQT